MTRRRTGGTRDWRSLLSQTMQKNRLSRGVTRARALLVWPEVVGPELARLTRARSQHGTLLFIETQDSVLANFLTLQRPLFLERLQAKLGDASVTELRFAVGSWERAVPAPPEQPLPPPDQVRAAELVAGVPENVRESALKAAQAITRARLWREGQGWPPCPVCGVPSRTSPCAPCRHLLEAAEVAGAARRLTRDPGSWGAVRQAVGETGAEAARYLALTELAGQLEELAVECVRSGGGGEYLAFLRAQAGVWLALHWRKAPGELTRGDWRALPGTPRQVLEAGR